MAMLNNQMVILYDTNTMMDKNKRANKDISYGDHTWYAGLSESRVPYIQWLRIIFLRRIAISGAHSPISDTLGFSSQAQSVSWGWSHHANKTIH